MRVRFFDTCLTEKGCTALAEAKGVNYEPVGKITCPDAAATLAQELLKLDKMAEEHVYMTALNSIGRLLGIFFISKGTVNCSLITPREVFIRALQIGASQIVLIHNHPSGSITPSSQDLEMTERIKQAGELVGVVLADHIIIAANGGGYLSFREAGLLQPAK